MQVDFYQLGGSPVEQVLPRIAARVIESGARLLVVSGDAALGERLDHSLWEGADDGFLAHGRAGGAHDALQPVLIADTLDPANGARHVALADGAWREEALGFDRAFLFFGEETLGEARAAWKTLAGREGVERRFWRQEEGRWTQVA